MPCAGSASFWGVAPSSSSCLGGLPSSRSGMSCAGRARCHTGGTPLPQGSACTPLARAVRPLPHLLPGSGGSPPHARACHALGAHTAVQGGPPLCPGSDRAPWARAVRPPPPPARARFARAAGAGGGASSSWDLSLRGGPEVVCSGAPPPVPLLSAAGAHCLVGGPPPLPPQPLALGAGGRSGGPLVAIRPLSGSCALRDNKDPPSGSWCPPCGGVSHWYSRGSPPATLLHAMGARCWVGVPPLPSSPSSAARVRRARQFGGGLSSVSPSAVARSARALLGVLSPLFSLWVIPLCPVAPWLSSSVAGPDLSWPPTNAAAASLPYSRRGCASL